MNNTAPASKRHIHVVGAVIVRDGKILAAQRAKGMALAGTWEFPGGKIEPGETPKEALQRELEEELHCQVLVGERLETTEHEYDFGVVILATFYCTLISGEPKLTEHAAVRWLAPEELDTVDWAPADIPAVRKLQADA